jgi:NDP-sugar pyrophosphorylase family protein
MKAVILAGGLGIRLRPFTEVIPKPLLPIGEKSLMEIQIERLRGHGVTDVFLATNYKANYIRHFFGDGSEFGVKVEVSQEDKPLGTAGPLTLLKHRLTEPFLVINGDILTLANFSAMVTFARAQGTELTIAVKKHITPYAFGDIHFEGNFVTDIEEKPDIVKFILAGIYVMTPAIFDYIPERQYFGMDSLIKNLLAARRPVAKYEIQEYWLDIGQIDHYQEAQQAYDTHFKSAER